MKTKILLTMALTSLVTLSGCVDYSYVDRELVNEQSEKIIADVNNYIDSTSQNLYKMIESDYYQNIDKIKEVVGSKDLNSEFNKVNHYIINKQMTELLERNGAVNNTVQLNVSTPHILDSNWQLVREVRNSNVRDSLCVDINNNIDTTDFNGSIKEESCAGEEGRSASMLIKDIPEFLGINYNEFEAFRLSPISTSLDFDGNVVINTNISFDNRYGVFGSREITIIHNLEDNVVNELSEVLEGFVNEASNSIGEDSYALTIIKNEVRSKVIDLLARSIEKLVDENGLNNTITL